VGGEIEGGGFQLCGGDAAVGGKSFHAALKVVGAAGGVGMGAPGGLDLAIGVVAGEGGGKVSFVKGQAFFSTSARSSAVGAWAKNEKALRQCQFLSLRDRQYFPPALHPARG
jgi:hypothetical protein